MPRRRIDCDYEAERRWTKTGPKALSRAPAPMQDEIDDCTISIDKALRRTGRIAPDALIDCRLLWWDGCRVAFRVNVVTVEGAGHLRRLRIIASWHAVVGCSRVAFAGRGGDRFDWGRE